MWYHRSGWQVLRVFSWHIPRNHDRWYWCVCRNFFHCVHLVFLLVAFVVIPCRDPLHLLYRIRRSIGITFTRCMTWFLTDGTPNVRPLIGRFWSRGLSTNHLYLQLSHFLPKSIHRIFFLWSARSGCRFFFLPIFLSLFFPLV